MTDYKAKYSNYKQYNNGDISQAWNFQTHPIYPPTLSTIKTDTFGPFAKTGYQTLKSGYPYYPGGTCSNIGRPLTNTIYETFTNKK